MPRVDELATCSPTRSPTAPPICCRSGSVARTRAFALCNAAPGAGHCAGPPCDRPEWMCTGICSSSAAAQNGSSSSAELGVAATGSAERITPRKPDGLRLAQLTGPRSATSMDGIWYSPIRRVRVGGHELVVHPLVVGLEPGEVVVVVRLRHERAHGALRRIETSASTPSMSCSTRRSLPSNAPARMLSYVQPYHSCSSYRLPHRRRW